MVLPSTSSRRSRWPTNGGHTLSCSVDGCKFDLSKCKDYHRRHRVCEIHAKTPTVMVGGQQQRFCQQCSRFHLLMEFDDVKRSCRKRLDCHNRRRRKPQPEFLSRSLFANHQGTSFSTYIAPQIPVNITSNSNWARVIKDEDTRYIHQLPSHFSDSQHPSPASFSIDYKGEKQFPFLQGSNSDSSLSNKKMLETSGHMRLDAIASSQSRENSLFTGGLTRFLNSDCALSLLSSPSRSSGICLNHMVVPADQIPMVLPLVTGMRANSMGQYSCSQASTSVSSTGLMCSGIEDDHVGPILVSDGNDADLHCHGTFQVAGNGSSKPGLLNSSLFLVEQGSNDA